MPNTRVTGILAALVGAGALIGGLVGAWREHALAHALDSLSDDEAVA